MLWVFSKKAKKKRSPQQFLSLLRGPCALLARCHDSLVLCSRKPKSVRDTYAVKARHVVEAEPREDW